MDLGLGLGLRSSLVDRPSSPSFDPEHEYIVNGDFDSDDGWDLGTGWAIADGVATHEAGAAGLLAQELSEVLVEGAEYALSFEVVAVSGGTVTPRIVGGTAVSGTGAGTVGRRTQTLTAAAGNNELQFIGSTSFAGAIDNVSLRRTK